MALRDGKSPTRTLTLVSLCVLVSMVLDFATEGAVRGYVRTIAQPIVSVSHRINATFFQNTFWMSRHNLQLEIERLSTDLARGEGTRAALEATVSENAILRSLARLAEHTDGTTVPITSSFSSSPYGTFTIGGGSALGINAGDIALAGDGFVLGEVTDVSLDSAVVSAVFSPGTVTDVVAGDVAFSLSGRGGGNARAEVPRVLPLTVGSPVVAPYYASRPVGVIGRIDSASSSAFADVFILFPYNLNTIQFVFVTPRL